MKPEFTWPAANNIQTKHCETHKKKPLKEWFFRT